jgi:hypothetical protein
MSGCVQKESADDPDHLDDAVDPRVQVSAPLAASPSGRARERSATARGIDTSRRRSR